MSLTYIREYAEDGGIFSEADAQPGSALTELMDRDRPSVKVAFELVAALGDILAIAEEDGEKHGDPKIGMVRVDANGNIALEDFRDNRRTTRAPEPKPAGPPSDIYGLGVLLHALLNTSPFGRVPKEEDAHDEAIVKKVMESAWGPAEGQDWTQELKEFIVTMMAHDPSQRPSADDVAEVLGNAADSLEGDSLGQWGFKSVKAHATQASAPSKSAPAEELEEVRSVHRASRTPMHSLDDEPETELAAPTTQRMGEEELGGPLQIGLDASLDETVLDSPASADDYLGMAHETKIDALPVAPMNEDSQSIHEQETVLGRNLLKESADTFERKGQAPAQTVDTAPITKTTPALEETLAANPSPQGIIKGPAIPPPPTGARSPEAKQSGSKFGLIAGLALLLGVGAYVSQQSKEDENVSVSQQNKEDENASDQKGELPGPIVEEGSEGEKTEDTAVAPTDLDDRAPEATKAPVEPKPELRQPAPSSKPKPATRASSPAPPAPKATPAPSPKPKHNPTPQPAPVAAPATAAPVASPPPYRIRLEIKGEDRRITCGDGQGPEVTGILNLTFDSTQYCRIEIDGGMGILNVAASGTYSCIKSGQVRCSKTR